MDSVDSANVMPTNKLRDALTASWFAVVTIGNVMLGRWDRGVSFGRFVLGIFRRRVGGTFEEIRAQTGHCYTVRVPDGLVCDAEARSRLVLLEDGKPIGPGHAAHHDIREHGGGRYSHWAGHVYFSTPDGSDPRSNGRVYSFRE
jgi:hypothetical protein